jgi:ribosomal protein S18 acetylase RimI-like enzyme
MNKYIIRKATLEDIPFLVEVVIAASKSNSDKLGFSTLFNLPEDKIRQIIGSMFEEEIDECEFSLSSFLITEHHGKPVAAVGGWIEGLIQKIPSSTLKSNLINFYFPKESIALVLSRSDIISDVLIGRKNLSLQIEYVYIDKNHRGKGLGEALIREHIKNALLTYPELKKVQVQLFGNNIPAIKLYEKCGFRIEKVFKSSNAKIFDYLPHNETLLMEIDI